MFQRFGTLLAALILVAACTSSPTPPSPAAPATQSGPTGGPSATAAGATAAASPAPSGTAGPTDTPAPPAASPAEPSPLPSLPAEPPPQPSPVGAPTGPIVTTIIGAAGGSLSAADGGITVTIPAGALAADTTIGIQPIEDTAPNGLGASYRLTPDGQSFAQPVQISFPYSDADIDGTAPEALGIAFQDDEGFWEWQDSTTVDTSAQLLSVSMTHFTTFSKAPGLQLQPLSASVHVNGTLQIVVTWCVKERANKAAVLFPCFDVTAANEGGIDPASWAVNGTPKGTLATGTVEGDVNVAVYLAPLRKPKAGKDGKSMVKVTVTAHLQGKSKLLTANIRIIDGYRVVGTWLKTNTNRVCPGAISPEVSDRVEFSLSPATVDSEESFLVTDIKNSDTKAKPPKYPVTVPTAAVRQGKPPEILTLNGGEVTKDVDQVSVALSGTGFTGSCIFIDTVHNRERKGSGKKTEEEALLKFFTTSFVDGKLVVNADADQPWSWFVTEQ